MRPDCRPANLGLGSAPTCRCSSVSSPLSFPLPRSLLQHPYSNETSENTGELHTVGPSGSRFPQRTPPPCCFQVSYQTSLPARCFESSLHPAPAFALLRSTRKALSAVFTFPLTPPWLPLFLALCAFPERHMRDNSFREEFASQCCPFTGLGLF